jgi:pyroglutamyl-peptidase
MPRTVLVTGFGPFSGVAVNPTQALALALDGRIVRGANVRALVLEVSFARAAQQLAQALLATQPVALLHFGVAAGSTQIRLESQAVNRITADRPDIDGACPADTCIDPQQPLDTALATCADLPSLAERLNRRGLPTQISTHAGRYVCNALYFASLAAQSQAVAPRPCLFVHVPLVDGERWTAERLVDAAEELIAALAQ